MTINIKVSGSLGQSQFNSIKFFGQNYLTACNRTKNELVITWQHNCHTNTGYPLEIFQ